MNRYILLASPMLFCCVDGLNFAALKMLHAAFLLVLICQFCCPGNAEDDAESAALC